jgi:4-amino-4-deoxy-L-arabinose transferase-like glycosyltransferase
MPLQPDAPSSPLDPPRPGELPPFVRNMLVALIVALHLGVFVFDHDIWAPTEPTVAGIVWEMRAEGDWAVPRIAGMPYLEKPPLYYWMATAACQAGGRLSAGLIRLPAALLGLACLWITYRIARRRFGGAAAMLAVLLAATFTSFVEYSHRASTDMAANFFAFLCLALFADKIDRPESTPRARRVADLCFALALAASFYSKNFFTFLVVLPPVFLWLAWKREFLRGLFIGAMTLLFTALVVAPWALALYHKGGWEFLRIVFVDNTVGRFFELRNVVSVKAGPLNDAYYAEKQNPWWQYAGALVVTAVPWVLALAAAVVNLFRRWREAGDFRRFMGLAFITLPVVLSLSSSKVVEYLTPIFLIEWVILAGFIRDVMTGSPTVHPWERRLFWINLVLVSVGAMAAPVVLVFVVGHKWPLIWLAPTVFFAWYMWKNTPQPEAAAGERPSRRGVFSFANVLQACSPARRQPDEAFMRRTLTYCALTFLMALGFLAPWLDRDKSAAPFFNAIRPESSWRDLYTTYCDDRRLPLIPFYLDRKPLVLANREDVFHLLRGERPVGIIVPEDFYQQRRADFAAIPHLHTVAFRGRTFLGYVANVPGGSVQK